MNYEQLVNSAIKNISNQRSREILSLRFGLKDGQRKTLESIGQKYNITRERVRQIEEAAFSDLKDSNVLGLFKPAFKSIGGFLNQEGGLVREERLLSSLTKIDSLLHPNRGALFFILTLGDDYQRFVESNEFYPFWTNAPESLSRARQTISFLISRLEENKQPVSQNHILDFIKQSDLNLTKQAVFSYLDTTKQINQNNFGQFGLFNWPEINPRGAKDKAYIVLKEKNQPLHFRQVADLINQANLGNNLAQAQTVHNELIKDPRFILVGRGTYALKEWGYQSGTVKEVIGQLLKENGPLTKEEILKKVLETRLVKPNTILINLQNRQYFSRDKNNKYSLTK
ncbi:MAG: sigma factor-like helix-turn-helix DNA-binding protein [Patescibacteria group bacterium]